LQALQNAYSFSYVLKTTTHYLGSW